MSSDIIQINNVSKDFATDFWKKKVSAVKNVSFEVKKGEIFGLVGPNGAGKTTTLKILMGLLKASAGTASINGVSVTETISRRELGYLPENAYYYDFLKTEEVLDFYGRLFGLPGALRKERTQELLTWVGLAHCRGIRLRTYSKGMLQRIGIAQALVNDPALVVLDEPMSGLDPIGRKEVRDIILKLAGMGKTILFSSHILSDVEALCDRVAILIKGEVKAYGDLATLVQPRVKSVEVILQGGKLSDPPSSWAGNVHLRKAGDKTVLVTSDLEQVQELTEWGRAMGMKMVSVSSHRETLEDLFIQKVEASA